MTSPATRSAMRALLDVGQSLWLDDLRRGMLRSGELQALIDEGLRGITSNPTIVEHALAGSGDYDHVLAALAGSPHSDREVLEGLTLEDGRRAADLFRPVYEDSAGRDGFVSLEISPALARDTAQTVAEGRRLWAAVDRPNVLIKVPGTREGWPAIERLLVEGINVNVTLLFSVEQYRRAAEAYVRALQTRLRTGRPVDRLASVASFFVSRVDAEADRRIAARGGSLTDLRGRVAIASARLAYAWFREHLRGETWQRLASAGARPQRLLWASTGNRNPAYSDVLYVESLIGPDTVITVPPDTLRRFEDHGTVRPSLSEDAGSAHVVMQQLAGGGVDFDEMARTLTDEGIAKFASSFEAALHLIAAKRSRPADPEPRPSALPEPLARAVARRLQAFEDDRVLSRVWDRDPTVWTETPDAPEIRDRLGWLTAASSMAPKVSDLHAFATAVRGSFTRIVLCGMGGSSLGPEVLWRTFGARAGHPSLVVLDSTDPGAVRDADAGGLSGTLFVISSKSGSTQESDSLLRYFWERTGGRGSQFVAITDPGTPLERLAGERGFLRTFVNPPDIGGRYSALSYFGLVPAALIGVDLATLLGRAHGMATACAPGSTRDHPAAWLGAVLGEAALAGRDKLTFVLPPALETFGLWLEQLIAESTGKEGKGILPVVGEPLGPPEVYGPDRVFVSLALAGHADPATASALETLERAGHPVIRLLLADRYGLGQEFFRWEFATALMGAVLRVNPFDQPDVAGSKANTKLVLAQGSPASPPASAEELERFLTGVRPGDYLAVLAYLPPTPDHDRRLGAIRLRLRDRLKVAVTVGYGPRYLHSTGQLHKGGPATGHFLQLVSPSLEDLPIPGERFTFGRLEAAQAEGDLRALRARGRPALRLEDLHLLER